MPCQEDPKKLSNVNLKMEEFRSKYNRNNLAGSSFKTELQSALEDKIIVVRTFKYKFRF